MPAAARTCPRAPISSRSEEHTSELQSHSDLVCRLLLEKKKKQQTHTRITKRVSKPKTERIGYIITNNDANYQYPLLVHLKDTAKAHPQTKLASEQRTTS